MPGILANNTRIHFKTQLRNTEEDSQSDHPQYFQQDIGSHQGFQYRQMLWHMEGRMLTFFLVLFPNQTEIAIWHIIESVFVQPTWHMIALERTDRMTRTGWQGRKELCLIPIPYASSLCLPFKNSGRRWECNLARQWKLHELSSCRSFKKRIGDPRGCTCPVRKTEGSHPGWARSSPITTCVTGIHFNCVP